MLANKLKSKLEEMRLLELQLFIIEFNRASQLDRSISKNSNEPKSGFRKALVKTCLALIKEMDDKTLSNAKIRKGIKNLSEKYGVSYGQAQKVVNVCLKQYMFITQNYEFSTELDCPLDSTTMKGCKISNNKMISVNADDYEKYQSMFSENFELKVLKIKSMMNRESLTSWRYRNEKNQLTYHCSCIFSLCICGNSFRQGWVQI